MNDRNWQLTHENNLTKNFHAQIHKYIVIQLCIYLLINIYMKKFNSEVMEQDII